MAGSNVARALIQEGETDAPSRSSPKLWRPIPSWGALYYFKGLIEKADGDYDAALVSLRTAESIYPRDRVVLNQIARILFLKKQYADALRVLEPCAWWIRKTPDALHDDAVLPRAGDAEKAAREEKLFRRFKADESSQAITGRRRMLSPEDNNERQQIHDHESAGSE